jgi:hypothetical protein
MPSAAPAMAGAVAVEEDLPLVASEVLAVLMQDVVRTGERVWSATPRSSSVGRIEPSCAAPFSHRYRRCRSAGGDAGSAWAGCEPR